MRILQIGKFYPIKGGVEKVMWDLTLGLASRGVRCDMLCACADGSNPRGEVIEPVPGARVICVPTLFKASSTMISPIMICKLRSLLRQAVKEGEAYDVVHIHHPDPMACLALLLSGYKGRVVMHYHSDIIGKGLTYTLYRPLEKWLVKRADLIVGTSPVYTESSPVLKNVQLKITTLPIGVADMSGRIDKDKVEAIRKRFEGRHLIFSLGRLIPYKGYSYLVDAAQYLDDSYRIVIGGTGPLREALESQIASKGLQNKVILEGFVSDDDLPSWYGACDIYCMSSIMKTEAFGIVQVEAMSCGKPLVATTIPESGVSWVNATGISGLNVKPRDAEALAGAFKTIIDSPELYGSLSEGSRARYEASFTPDKMITDCVSIYQELER